MYVPSLEPLSLRKKLKWLKNISAWKEEMLCSFGKLIIFSILRPKVAPSVVMTWSTKRDPSGDLILIFRLFYDLMGIISNGLNYNIGVLAVSLCIKRIYSSDLRPVGGFIYLAWVLLFPGERLYLFCALFWLFPV